MRRYLLVALWPTGLAAITAATAFAARRSPQPPGRGAGDARIPYAAGPGWPGGAGQEPAAAAGQDPLAARARRSGHPEGMAPDLAPDRSRATARADLTARDILRFGAVTGAGAAASYGVMRAIGPVIMRHGPAIDEPVYRWTVSHQVARWAAITERLNKLGNSWTIWGAAGTGAACLSVTWPRKKWLPPTALAGAVIVDKYVTLALRRTFSRVGPPGSPLGTYPSGGCDRAILFYGLIANMLWREFSGSHRGKVWATGAVAALAFNVAYCREYLSKHWLTDILSGLLYGVVLLAPFLVGVRLVAGPAGLASGEDRPAVPAPARLNLAAALISPAAKLTPSAA